tara:strand:- start:139 stop:387 length:249 start_codon:yes stop_codon:yes gene_type:complete
MSLEIKDGIDLVEFCSDYFIRYELPEYWYEWHDPKGLWKLLSKGARPHHKDRDPEDIWWDIIYMAKDLNKKLELGFDMRGIR